MTEKRKLDSTSAWKNEMSWNNVFKSSIAFLILVLLIGVVLLTIQLRENSKSLSELSQGSEAKEDAVKELCKDKPRDNTCEDAEKIPSTAEILDGAEVQEEEIQDKENQESEIQESEIQNPEIQNDERQQRERQNRENQDNENQEDESQEEELQNPEEQEAEIQDDEIQNPEEQESEIQDKETQDPEPNDPEPNDPQDPPESFTFQDSSGMNVTCTRTSDSSPRNPTYQCEREPAP